MGTWAHRCSKGRDWDVREVSSCQPSRQSSHHFHHHLTLRWSSSRAHVQQRLQAGGTTFGVQGGKGEENRRAWERIGEEERRLREREARVMGGADRVAEGRTEGQGRPRRGETQAVEECNRLCDSGLHKADSELQYKHSPFSLNSCGFWHCNPASILSLNSSPHSTTKRW